MEETSQPEKSEKFISRQSVIFEQTWILIITFATTSNLSSDINCYYVP